MIDIYYKNQDFNSAWSALEALRLNKKVLTNYVDLDKIKVIVEKAGKMTNYGKYFQKKEGEDIKEELDND